MSNFDLEDLNMIDITAKRAPEALTEFKGELVKGEEIHKKTGLTLNDIDLVVEVLEKSLVIEIPNVFQRLPPYNFLRYRNNCFWKASSGEIQGTITKGSSESTLLANWLP